MVTYDHVDGMAEVCLLSIAPSFGCICCHSGVDEFGWAMVGSNSMIGIERIFQNFKSF